MRIKGIIEPVRRWAASLIVLLACVLGILLSKSSSSLLLADSDTRGLLAGIAKRDSPLSWFASDWPIENHFYRPVSTLTLEINHRVPSLNNPAGFGLVNALLCMFSVCALFWLVRELTDNPLQTALATAFFTLWNLDSPILSAVQSFVSYAVWLLPLLLLLPNRDYRKVLSAMLVVWFLLPEIDGISSLRGFTLGWVPGRTATTMTVFALCALASYAHYERFSLRKSRVLASTDLPATKSARHTPIASKFCFLWPIASLFFLALALGSYEQAVMVPGLLVGLGVWFALAGYRGRWGWHFAFWGLLFGYLALRHAVLPQGVSQYQSQQFRNGPGVWLEIGGWLMPCYQSIRDFAMTFAPDVLAPLAEHRLVLIWTLLSRFVPMAWSIASNVLGYATMAKRLPMALGGWALSFVAFLPMAWLHRFDHYYYLPMALRTLYVVGMSTIACQMVVTACSPRSIQAPPRLDPAPGSLPRP